jgi:general secretion pathway protein E
MLQIPSIENVDLKPVQPDALDITLATKNYVLFSEIEGELHVILSQRYLSVAFDYLAKQSFNYPLLLADEDSYDRLYNKFLEIRTDSELGTLDQGQDEMEDDDISLSEFLRNSSDLLTSEESAPVIKFVNALFYQAIKRRASDIHIEVHEKRSEVRFRIDGALIKNTDIDNKIANLIISRIKVISNLDLR